TQSAPVSRWMFWAGWIISGLLVLFLLFDGVGKLLQLDFVVDATVKLGYRESVVLPLGVVLTACTILYAIPRTSVLGAILLTGYLGGAVATRVHHSDSIFEITFPIIFGVLVWGGLWLRDARLRALAPLRS